MSEIRSAFLQIKTLPILSSVLLLLSREKGMSISQYVEHILIQNKEVKDELIKRNKRQTYILNELIGNSEKEEGIL